jgi:hypothetical protein
MRSRRKHVSFEETEEKVKEREAEEMGPTNRDRSEFDDEVDFKPPVPVVRDWAVKVGFTNTEKLHSAAGSDLR